jgi:hypothetical protein
MIFLEPTFVSKISLKVHHHQLEMQIIISSLGSYNILCSTYDVGQNCRIGDLVECKVAMYT